MLSRPSTAKFRPSMRYSREHKAATRRRLLESSKLLAKRGGFDATGVDSLMSAIGLTAGAFYSHFPSKQALFQALIEEEMQRSSELLAGDPDAADNRGTHEGLRGLRAYLSRSHADHPERGCVLPALGGEIARAGPEVREVVERWLKQTHKTLSAGLGDPETAWSLMAQCVGALMLARAVASERTRNEIIAANRRRLERTSKQAKPGAARAGKR